MLRLTIIWIFISVTVARAPKARSNASKFDGRIVGGSLANIEDFPYQLSLRDSRVHICGASILSATRALTAAHCTYERNAGTLSVRAGSKCHNKTNIECQNDPLAQEVYVLSICDHPRYNDETTDNDVSVLKLHKALIFGSLVQPIPIVDSPLATGTLATVSGWGKLSVNDFIISDLLMKVDVPKVSQKVCEDAYAPTEVTGNMVCFGFTSGGKDSCEGDSGGPLVYNGTQVGIVSMGDGCGAVGFPGIYTDLSVAQIKAHILKCSK